MKKSILFIAVSALLFTSCQKDSEVEGCTDMSADNYNSEATLDDGSCTFDTPTPSVDYTLEFFSYHTTGNWHEELLAVVNGDTLAPLIDYTITQGTEELEGDYIDNQTEPNITGAQFDFQLNTNYDILILDESTKTLLYEVHGSFVTQTDPSEEGDITFSKTSGGENVSGINSVLGTTSWSIDGGEMGKMNIETRYLFIIGIQY